MIKIHKHVPRTYGDEQGNGPTDSEHLAQLPQLVQNERYLRYDYDDYTHEQNPHPTKEIKTSGNWPGSSPITSPITAPAPYPSLSHQLTSEQPFPAQATDATPAGACFESDSTHRCQSPRCSTTYGNDYPRWSDRIVTSRCDEQLHAKLH